MAFIAESRRNKFFFGTENRMQFFPTPNRGADVSPTGWEAGGTLLNGGGYQLNSFGSHKNFMFEWPSSSAREVAQKMKSYADGTYGRGLIYFIDPLTWTTNMLPAQWADPSMGLGYEGTSLVYGVDPVSVPTSGWESNDLPVNSAFYDLAGVATGWRGREEAVFIPVPSGYTLSLGSFHSQAGTGRVYYREQATNGALGVITAVTPLANNASQVVNTFVSGANLAGVWLYVGKSGSGAGSVTLAAMIGRLIPSVKTQSTMVAQNLFTNPNLVGDGTWAETRRNRIINPGIRASGTFWNVPGFTQCTGTEQYSVGAGGPFDGTGYVEATVATVASSSSRVTFTTALGNDTETLAVGATRRLSVYVYSNRAVSVTPLAQYYLRSSASYMSASVGTPVTLEPNTWTRISVVGTVPTGADMMRVSPSFGTSGDLQAGDVLRVSCAMRGDTDLLAPYFDGSSPDFSIDPDMRQRWLGAPNASESVMEIERVRGLTGNNCIAGVSSWEGKPAVRLIPTSSDPNSFAQIFPLEPAGTVRTLVGTANLIAPLTGTLGPFPLLVRFSGQASPPAIPNAVGSYPQRLTHTYTAPGTYASLRHGGALGSGDVWWTDIGLFAGEYDGPAFAGDSSGLVISGRNVRTQWDGTPDDSTSSAWTITPEFDRLKEGPWIGGQGHSGCRFVGKPTYVNNSGVNDGQVSFAASFREVGSWVYG